MPGILSRLLTILLISAGAGASAALAACEAELAEIDRMLENPDLNEMQVNILEGIRQSAPYLCESGQEERVRQMLEHSDALLKSVEGMPEQLEAAKMQKQRQREKEAAIGEPPITTAGAERIFDRPEDMFQYWYKDVDRYGDGIRVLYATSPSLEQGRSGDWTVNVYAVEALSNGTFSQHRLYSKQAYEHTAMGLRPGRDEILIQRSRESPEQPDRLQRWSIPEGRVLSSVEIPSPYEPRWNWSEFRGVTLDGNVFFTTTQYDRNRGGGKPHSTAAWFEFSPDGRVVGKGRRDLENARQQIRHWFPAHTGGVAMTLDTVGKGDRGLSEVLDESYPGEIGGREIEGVVSGELRVAVTGDDSSSIDLSPALERDIMWIGEMSADRDLPGAEQMRQSREQMTFMRNTEVKAGARQNLRVIKPTPAGYGALVRKMSGRDSPDNGLHFLEVTTEGVRRQFHVQPLAERYEVKFENFAATADGRIYLFGRTRNRRAEADAMIVVLNGSTEDARAVSIVVPDGAEFDEIVADGSGLWIAGHVMSDSLGAPTLWLRHVPL
ncbi:hypothetical protein [Lentisalinibacter salinarum]|uniref:hypothetical protein n=1 Tax=Lentisalinibacter salinarum TaxID=2992239 RepID=UPI0038655F23